MFLTAIARNKVLREERRVLDREAAGAARVFLGRADRPRPREMPDNSDSPAETVILSDQWNHVLQSRPRWHRRLVELRSERQDWKTIVQILGIHEGHARRIMAALLKEVFGE